MTLLETGVRLVERWPLPDTVVRLGIRRMVGHTARRLDAADPALEQAFAAGMTVHPIAAFTADANAQHYELPPAFFGHVLGPARKYSCCLYNQADTLERAEQNALEQTAAHALLADDQDILELGCGWGSLSLWMAERYPAARITAVSNSAAQRRHIQHAAAERGLTNLRVITADMNTFVPEGSFDRVVSVEMFEHMANWTALLGRVRDWLKLDARVFIHVFTHRSQPYRFDHTDPADWIAKYFFTGGIMPSHGLMWQFPALFEVEQDWRWNGVHYQRTALDWLARFDARRPAIDALMREVYGEQARLWTRRWRFFFLATAGLFGHDGGAVWGVSHYRLRATSAAAHVSTEAAMSSV